MNSAARVRRPDPHAVLGQRLNLRGIDWATYRKISDALTGRHLRLTYDRGSLEFMTISSLHGRMSRLLGRFVTVLAEELDLKIGSYGDMTCDREDLERGLEADETFYIRNEARVRGKEQIDLNVDPPPDLAIEVDITPHSPNRQTLYAALGVPEVWRYDGKMLEFLGLTIAGNYQLLERSRQFSVVTASDIMRFLRKCSDMDEVALIRAFRKWVQDEQKKTKAKPKKKN